MREFKFRIWDTVDNKWLFGYDYESLGGFSLLGEVVLFGEISSIPLGRLNDVRVMQFTGLKDKNGKEIYEGDLLRYPGHPENFTAYEVFFHDGDANFSYDIGYCIARTHFQGNIAGGLIPSFKPKTTAQMEVIGNIYQNPELL